MPLLNTIKALPVLDSRGNWTVEAQINTASGIAPAGASKGSSEVPSIEAKRACDEINKTLAPLLIGKTLDQTAFDETIIKHRATIGGNGTTALSLAMYNLSQHASRPQFPFPLGNVVGGGMHGGSLAMQEILLCPNKAKTFPDACDKLTSAYHTIHHQLAEKGFSTGINDEGALTANLTEDETLDIIRSIALSFGCVVGLDVAASSFYNPHVGNYVYIHTEKMRSPEEQTDYILRLAKEYKLFYIEDPLHENDFEGFAELRKKAKRTLIVGDDLTTTHIDRLHVAHYYKSINAMIVKPNQVGTVTQAREAVEYAKKYDIIPVLSHRSGETTDTTICRLALDWNVPFVKTGIVDIRTAKLNEFLRMWYATEKPRMARY